ncbi:nonribosomal peptide synthetase MxaA [Candidatus Methylocalor cossyra]|uniref:MxaA protein n=1 Tax=Candidatus Methylocalor cossyra TaxID=3108543 RepID=A0ABM9NDX8_9GAMM
MKRSAWVALFLVASAPLGGAAADALLEREAPRPFGHVIGDLLRHRLLITAPTGSRLDSASLPQPGPLNRWLELRQVQAAPAGAGRYRVELEYQTFYSPLQVKSLTIPGFTLRFTGPRGATAVEVPPWPFQTAPIHGLAVVDREGAEPLRPDALPPAPDLRGPRRRCLGFALAALVALVYLGHSQGLIGPPRRGRHFREADRTLARLQREGQGAAGLRAAFAVVHRAFDRTWGEPLFAAGLPAFFAGHGAYAALREEIEGFFRASYALFFGGETPPGYDIARLQALCRACLRAERSRP